MPQDEDRRLVALYDAHAPSVWRYVVHLTGDPAGADDIVQETLLRAWRSPRIMEQEPESTRSWMFTVARNLVIDEARSARRRHEIGVAETPDAGRGDGTDALFESLLIEVRLLRRMREYGPRIAALTTGLDLGQASKLAEAVLARVRDLAIHHPRSSVSRYVTASAGVVSLVPPHDAMPTRAYESALRALKDAKELGKNRVVSRECD